MGNPLQMREFFNNKQGTYSLASMAIFLPACTLWTAYSAYTGGTLSLLASFPARVGARYSAYTGGTLSLLASFPARVGARLCHYQMYVRYQSSACFESVTLSQALLCLLKSEVSLHTILVTLYLYVESQSTCCQPHSQA